MNYIDTHTHIYLPEFDSDRDEVVERAIMEGTEKLLMPNIDISSISQMLAVEARFPGICIPMMGLHPTSVKEDYSDQLERMEQLWQTRRFIAVGEIGIDLYWDKTFIAGQKDAFRRQLTFALKKDVPVVIHSRESFPEVFEILHEFDGKGLKGVMHAFTGSSENATEAVNMGLMLGIGGIVTFKNSGLDQVLLSVSPDHLILETDSPYLAPVPHRGKRNESSYLPLVNRKLAEVYKLSESEISAILFDNSKSLFSIQ
jgi:TatD DNase family protein